MNDITFILSRIYSFLSKVDPSENLYEQHCSLYVREYLNAFKKEKMFLKIDEIPSEIKKIGEKYRYLREQYNTPVLVRKLYQEMGVFGENAAQIIDRVAMENNIEYNIVREFKDYSQKVKDWVSLNTHEIFALIDKKIKSINIDAPITEQNLFDVTLFAEYLIEQKIRKINNDYPNYQIEVTYIKDMFYSAVKDFVNNKNYNPGKKITEEMILDKLDLKWKLDDKEGFVGYAVEIPESDTELGKELVKYLKKVISEENERGKKFKEEEKGKFFHEPKLFYRIRSFLIEKRDKFLK